MKKFMFGFFLPIILLTGCWDQNLIKDADLVYAASFDKGENGKIKGGVIVRGFVATGGESGGGTPENEFISAEGNTIRNIRMNLDRTISGTLTTTKIRVSLYNEDLGREGLYPYLDIFYREPASSLNARIAITQGEAAKYLEFKRIGNTLIGEHIEEIIVSSEQNTIVQKIDVQTICPLFFDPGKDPIIPYLVLDEEKPEVKVSGLALFQDDKMTGTLNVKDSTLLLLLMKKKKKITRIVRKVNSDKEQEIENYVTIHVSKSKSKMNVITDSSGIGEVMFDVKLKASIVEYPFDKLSNKKEIEKLEKKLSKILTKDMNDLIIKLQEANSDPIGIGRELIAFYPDTWKNLDWRKDYPNIPIKAKVSVQITDNGIIE